MIFSSVLFLFRFLPIFLLCYYLVPGRAKNIVLLAGSLIFYAWGEPVYILLMLFSILSDYIHGILIGRYRGRKAAKRLLVSSIVINLLLLGFFKYADFLIGLINTASGASIPLLKLPLPIGISFYTFQTMSYTIDVYRGEAKVQRNFLDFAVFVTMFPQLIAGPIVKYRQVEEDLHLRKPDIEQIRRGAMRFIVGLAKKVLLANNLGQLWNMIAAMDYSEISGLTAWLGILAFAFQIYFDFSGYSDMAIGLGDCMGFHFPENFKYPYISASVTEFWRRWHITLSSWFKEYVYIPLGGNRKGLARQIFNILVVWMLTGIWHGAGINFLLWGLWFALFLILEKLFLGKILRAVPPMLGRIYTWLVVIVGWVLFELPSFDAILGYLRAMFGQNGVLFIDRRGMYLNAEYSILFALAVIGSTPLVSRLSAGLAQAKSGGAIALRRVLEKVLPAALLLLSIAYIVEASYNPFLYFRF